MITAVSTGSMTSDTARGSTTATSSLAPAYSPANAISAATDGASTRTATNTNSTMAMWLHAPHLD